MVELTDGGRLVAVAPNPSIDRLVEVGELRRGDMQRPRAVTVVLGREGFRLVRVAATLGASITAPSSIAAAAGVAASVLGGGDIRDAVVQGTGAAASSRVPGAGRLERATAAALNSEVIVEVLR